MFISRNWYWFQFFYKSINFLFIFTFLCFNFSIFNEIIKLSLFFFLLFFRSFSNLCLKSFFFFLLFLLTLFSFSNNLVNRRFCLRYWFRSRFLIIWSSRWLRNTNFEIASFFSFFSLFLFLLLFLDLNVFLNRFSLPYFFDVFKFNFQ